MGNGEIKETWEIEIDYKRLPRELKKEARAVGYSKEDYVFYRIDGRTGEKAIQPKDDVKIELPSKCAKCGNESGLLEAYELVHGVKVSEEYGYAGKDMIRTQTKYKMLPYSMLLCRDCVKRQQLKTALKGFGQLIASFLVFLFLVFVMFPESSKTARDSGMGAAYILILIIIPSLIVISIKSFIRSSKRNFNGMDLARDLFKEQYPGGFPDGDAIWTADEYNRQVRSGKLR